MNGAAAEADFTNAMMGREEDEEEVGAKKLDLPIIRDHFLSLEKKGAKITPIILIFPNRFITGEGESIIISFLATPTEVWTGLLGHPVEKERCNHNRLGRFLGTVVEFMIMMFGRNIHLLKKWQEK